MLSFFLSSLLLLIIYPILHHQQKKSNKTRLHQHACVLDRENAIAEKMRVDVKGEHPETTAGPSSQI